jgi:predicted peptidase
MLSIPFSAGRLGLLGLLITSLMTGTTMLNTADGADAPKIPPDHSYAYSQHPIGSTPAPYGFISHLPPGVTATSKEKYPLVFFLHGHGELGDSDKTLYTVAKHGPFKHFVARDDIGKLIDDHKAIVIAPQGLKSDNWFKTNLLLDTLKYVISAYPVDKKRIYITGLSMGGGGTWAICSAIPDQIAAGMPVCGAGKPNHAEKLLTIPLWAHHAVDDGTVKFPETTQKWIDLLLAQHEVKIEGGIMNGHEMAMKSWTGTLLDKKWTWKEGREPADKLTSAKLTLTVHPNGGHDSWSRTYNNPNVWKWLFAQIKP